MKVLLSCFVLVVNSASGFITAPKPHHASRNLKSATSDPPKDSSHPQVQRNGEEYKSEHANGNISLDHSETNGHVISYEDDSIMVAGLKSQIERLQTELGNLREQMKNEEEPAGSIMRDWKRWYERMVESNYKQQDEFKKEAETSNCKLSELQFSFDLVTEKLKSTEIRLEQAVVESNELRTRGKQIRQEHLNEIQEFQEQLERSQALAVSERSRAAHELQRSQQKSNEQLEAFQRAAAIELEATKSEFQGKLQIAADNISSLELLLRTTNRRLDGYIGRCAVLEREKQSLKSLTANGWKLVKRRAKKRVSKLTCYFAREQYQPSLKPVVRKVKKHDFII